MWNLLGLVELQGFFDEMIPVRIAREKVYGREIREWKALQT